VTELPENLVEPLSDLVLTDTVLSALEIAASKREGQPLATFDVLAALITVDPIGEWEWVQLQATPIVEEEAPRFRDPNSAPAGRWHNVPLTADATHALVIAKRIAHAYRFVPVPPGVLALGLVWEPDSGATVALLDQSQLRHEQLLELLQEALLDGKLEGLQRSLSRTDEQPPLATAGSDGINDLDGLLRDAAAIGPRRGGHGFVMVTTPRAALASIASESLLWRQAANKAGISLEEYQARLAGLVGDARESIDAPESELDSALPGIRLTAELTAAIEVAERLARHVAGSESVDVLALLPTALVTTNRAASRRAVPEHARAAFAEALTEVACGALLHNLDELVRTPASSAEAETASRTVEPATAASRSTSLGFNLGTFVGAFIVAGFGGLPLGAALAVAFLVRFGANRARKKARPRWVIQAGAGIAILTAIALAATTATNFADQRAALQQLRAGEIAIDRRDLVGAMRTLASSALLENESVRVRVLQSCVDWDLGYRDEAAAEAQLALTLGYRPYEKTHYAGRSCFLDAADFHGVSFLRVQPKLWLIFPRPYQTDARGQQLLAIAEHNSKLYNGDALIAIACLADRYDLRSLATFGFDVGINSNLKRFGRPTSKQALIRCLKSESVNYGYKYFKFPTNHAWVFVPKDAAARIPTPKKHRPPKDVCWTHFPLRGPCNKT
jgi:hypothetical protein